MVFRPCIDLHAGKVKQIVGSSLKAGNDAALVTNFEATMSAADFAKYVKLGGWGGWDGVLRRT